MKVKNGQPIKYKKNTRYYEVCCDCGLCHMVVFDKTVTKIAYRDDYETEKAQKKKSKKSRN